MPRVARSKLRRYSSRVEQDSSWRHRLAHSIGRQVHHYRNARQPKMSAQQLADECDKLGLPIPRSVIAKIESGSRSFVSADELLVLAAALRVPPARLIAPVGFADTVEALPERSWSSWDAAKWIIGDMTLVADGQLGSPHPFEPIRLFREHDELVAHRQKAFASADTTGLGVIDIDRRIVDARARMRSLGLRPPPLPGNLAHLDEWTGRPTDATQS